jgi:GNAT superfamily N-acetyltransferase
LRLTPELVKPAAKRYHFCSTMATSTLLAGRQFLRLTPELVKPAAKCVAATFCAKTSPDPFAKAFALNAADWEAMAYPFLERSAHSFKPTSVVCFNKSTGEVDGIMLNEDLRAEPPQAYQELAAWKPVRSIFKTLHMRYLSTGHASRGETLQNLYFTCVRPAAQGRGVMKQLWKETISAAQEYNYQNLVASAGSESVRSVLRDHLGFREMASVGYEEHGNALEIVEFQTLPALGAKEYQKLSLLKRKVPSDLYV